MAALLGVPNAADTLGLTASLADADGIDRVLVLLIDGLGWHQLPALTDNCPLLATVSAGSVGRMSRLRCTFPSTTPTSLVSLGTGTPPGQHGVLGFTVAIPGSDQVLKHIAWAGEPAPQDWQPVPTWFERATHAGVDARALLPAAYVGSGLTNAAYRGARFVPVSPDDDYAAALVHDLTSSPGLVFGYTADLDTAAHLSGIGSVPWHEAARRIDTMLRRVVDRLPATAAVVVTADHGGLNVPAQARIDIADDPRLRAHVGLIAGEPRVRYVHTDPGAAAEVASTWREILGKRAEVLLRANAIDAGLFGPVHPRNVERIGDVVVISNDDEAVFASDHEAPEVTRLIGFHGGTTDAEMDIPLIVLHGGSITTHSGQATDRRDRP